MKRYNGALPVGQHACEWDKFVERFGGKADNKRRRRLILGLAQVCLLLVEAGCQTVWVDGSFVTREKWPRDFDLCYDASELDLDLLHPLLRDLSSGRWQQKRDFGGEALPSHMAFRPDGETVLEAFAHDRKGDEKGLIRLIPPHSNILKEWTTQRQNERSRETP